MFRKSLVSLVLVLIASSAFAADIDPATLDALARQQGQIQDLQAERDALAAQCAKECKPVPAPKKASTKPTAPKAAAAPKTPVPTVDPRIAELEEEVRFLRAQLELPPAPITVVVAPPIVNVAAPIVTITPVVESHTEHTNTVVVEGTRIQVGLIGAGVMAPPLPGDDIVLVDREKVFARIELDLGNDNQVGIEGFGGYGFTKDSTEAGAMFVYARNLGFDVDFVAGAGVNYLCEEAFSGGSLCSASRFGPQGQIGFDFHAFGPINAGIYGGGGYDMVDASDAGVGGVGYGFLSARFFWGELGKATSSAPK
ncbi:MAG: hypothetical protein AAB473_01925 [Patescibacteria group bacterium]